MKDHMAHAGTLNEVLHLQAEKSASKNWLTLYQRYRAETRLSFGELLSGAQYWAAALQNHAVAPGDRVLLVLPTEKGFYEAFWGILEAGATPVPLYPPVRLGRMDAYLDQLQSIADDCSASALITNQLIAPLLQRVQDRNLPFIVAGKVQAENRAKRVDRKPADLALLQYTSGSTGSQKGVTLNHTNLLANIRAIGKRLKPTPQDIALSWLPLYHDMGLIGLMMGSIYFGVPLIAMSPIDFLRKPVRWIHLMSRHRATFSAAPNFAYSLLARKARDRDLENIDLSSLADCPVRRRAHPSQHDRKLHQPFPACGISTRGLLSGLRPG